MKISLLMVSYRKDAAFAEYAMRSCKKFATGFYEYIVVVPHEDVEIFEQAAFGTEFIVKGFDERNGKGMLHHMAVILEGDLWCPGADGILVLDSDCLFTAPITPAEYMNGSRPVICRERFEDFKRYSERYSWKECVRNATGIDPEWETMVRFPMIHLPALLKFTRELITKHTGMDWKEYVLSGRNVFPQQFAEFPTLGAIAIQHFNELYHFVDWRVGEPCDMPPMTIKQLWSHGGLEMINDRHPTQTARQCMEEILK